MKLTNRICSLFAAGSMLATLMVGTASASTLVYCSEASPEKMSPVLATSQIAMIASGNQIYNTLITTKPGTTELVPSLAESWEVSTDGLTYTFHIRKDVQFQTTDYFKPSRPLNSSDVVFSIQRQLIDSHPYHPVGGGEYPMFGWLAISKSLKSLEADDDLTVVFHLNSPDAVFLSNIALEWASIYSKEYADNLLKEGAAEKIDTQPVGTGPFQLVEYKQDSYIRYKAHTNYWAMKAGLAELSPQVDDLVFAIVPDAGVRYQKLVAGECHIIASPNPADIPKMKSDPKLQVLEQPGLDVGYIGFNTQKPPFDNSTVRKALAMAIDKKNIVKVVFQGISGTQEINPMPPPILGYNPDIQDYPYDPDAAKAMLAQAGFPDGFETKIFAMPVQRPYNPNGRRMAELIQADLAKVGVKAEIVTYEWGEYLKRTKEGEHEIFQLGWIGDNSDPDNFLRSPWSCEAVKTGNNRVRWCDPQFDKLLDEAVQLSDNMKRAAIYKKAQEIWHQSVPAIVTAHSIQFTPVRKEVIGYIPSPLGSRFFVGLSVK